MNLYFIYLLVANVAGFLSVLTEVRLRKKNKNIAPLILELAVVGGALGEVLAIFAFKYRPDKENMLEEVMAFTMLVIWIVCVIFGFSVVQNGLKLDIIGFFTVHSWILVYLFVMNVIAFAFFASDKWAAVRGKWRVPIVVLLGVSALGGAIGGMIAMYTLRHKTQKNYFTIGMPLILVMHILVLLLLVNIY